MEVQVNEESPLVQTVTVNVPDETVRTETNRRLRDMASRVKIAGFRPGKAPMAEIRKRYLASARIDALEGLVNSTLRDALAGETFRKAVFVGQPMVSGGAREGETLSYTVRVEFLPVLSDVNWKGVAVKRPRVDVPEADVDAELTRAQESQAQLVPVEDRTIVEAGDVVVLSYVAQGDAPGVDEIKADDQTVELANPNLLEGFAAGIVGAEVGVPKPVKLTMPESFPEPSLAGVEIELSVTVSAIRRRDVPALDDAFAAAHTEHETLDAWRAAVRANLEAKATDESRKSALSDTARALVAANEVALPEQFVVAESVDTAKRRLEEFAKQGMDPKRMNLKPEQIAPMLRGEVERQLRTELLLTAVAKELGIELTDEDVDAFLEKVAVERGEPIAKVRARYHDVQQRQILRANLTLDRALESVLAEATVTEFDPKDEADEGEETEAGDAASQE